MEESKITIHMVSSLDGFIARKDNSVSWFETSDHYAKGMDEPDPVAFLKTIDCYVMGSRTYELALELSKSYGWAYGDKPTVVTTSRNLQVDRANIEIYSGELSALVVQLKARFKNIWVVGGARLAKEFIRQQLVDEIRMTILPIVLGDGTPFFDRVGIEQLLHVEDVTVYKNGMVELCYAVRRGKES